MIDKNTFLSDMLNYVAKDEDPDDIINKVLQFICKTFNSDRAYIFENAKDGTINNTYEYCREGVEPQIDNLKNLPYDLLGTTWYKEYSKKKNILIYDIEEYRQESEWVYKVLKPQGINTLVTGPLTKDGEIIGMYGVDNPPVDLMRDISDVIATLEIVITMLLRVRDYSRMVQEEAGIDNIDGLPDKKAGILNNVLFNAFSSSSDHVYTYVLDVKTGITRWSPNMVSYFGLPSEYTYDAEKDWNKHIHQDDLKAYKKDITAIFSGESEKHNCQYRAMNKYGDYVWVECKGTVVTRNNGDRVFAGLMTRLDRQSIYDSLTGLKTKNQFYEYNFSAEKGIVMLLGVDHFKNAITTYGYDAGDEILMYIGRALISVVGDMRCVFRFGGDEFMIILPNATNDDAKVVFDNIKRKTSSIILENGVAFHPSLSAAGVTYEGTGTVTDTLVNKLETTLVYVKQDNRGTYFMYNDEMRARERRIRYIKKELADSIEHNFRGFELFYQPWMNEEGVEIVGCEALLRWKGETIKDSYPGEFIPILEEEGGIIPVGQFVMREAMRQQKEWEDKYGEFLVSFNVSYKQFLQKGYVEDLIATANELKVNTNHMVIELTESCDVQSPDVLADVFRRLRDAGFRIALDDFGTGYSSMEMLRKLPSDCIKIEHSFVRELSDQGHDLDFAIIRAILSLCKDIGQKVVIEGVENEKVAEIIKSMKAGFLQGYYYSKPVCKNDFEMLVEAG